MIVISHRGNLNGTDKDLENNPEHIRKVINRYDVEIDLWALSGKLFLGHNNPLYEVDESFFSERMWIHCKNLEAVRYLNSTSHNWFWHETDKLTLTSHKHIWCFPGVYILSLIHI